jgi:hypothetical protein
MPEERVSPASESPATSDNSRAGKLTIKEPQIADILRACVQKKPNLNSELLLARLHKVAVKPYEEFVQNELKRIEMTGERRQGMDPPRDRASYLLDHELPPILLRTRETRTPLEQELHQFGGELDAQTYLALIGLYATQQNDHEGARRVWDTLTNQSGLLFTMLDEFCKRRHDEMQKLRARIVARNERICQRARELRKRHATRRFVSILARQFDLTADAVLSILKDAEIL